MFRYTGKEAGLSDGKYVPRKEPMRVEYVVASLGTEESRAAIRVAERAKKGIWKEAESSVTDIADERILIDRRESSLSRAQREYVCHVFGRLYAREGEDTHMNFTFREAWEAMSSDPCTVMRNPLLNAEGFRILSNGTLQAVVGDGFHCKACSKAEFLAECVMGDIAHGWTHNDAAEQHFRDKSAEDTPDVTDAVKIPGTVRIVGTQEPETECDAAGEEKK